MSYGGLGQSNYPAGKGPDEALTMTPTKPLIGLEIDKDVVRRILAQHRHPKRLPGNRRRCPGPRLACVRGDRGIPQYAIG
jgi:hypothetical protein